MDAKKIEEKAINKLKEFIEDSEVISQFISDNDKGPCWDGHLYLYRKGMRDKAHLIGRVPVQIKGKLVEHIQIENWKYPLKKEDLKAYLHEPTFFIVCQIAKDTNEKKLFYSELLPDIIKHLLLEMGNNESRNCNFFPLTDNLQDFEDQLIIFFRNGEKMRSFVDFDFKSFKEVVNGADGEKFKLSLPVLSGDLSSQLRFLTTNDHHLYYRPDNTFKIDLPIDGTVRLSLTKNVDKEVSVGNRVFFDTYKNDIINGRNIISIGNVLTINMPIDDKDPKPTVITVTIHAKTLKEEITKCDFVIALHDIGILKIGKYELNMKVNENSTIKNVRMALKRDRAMQNVLDKIHVEKDLRIDNLTENDQQNIDILIETIENGNAIHILDGESSIHIVKLSNINLLLWCSKDEEGNCIWGDFFDGNLVPHASFNGKEEKEASPYSCLRDGHLWQTIDNIYYDGLIAATSKMCKVNEDGYAIANMDVLAMILASDAIERTDVERHNRLLLEAAKLNKWLEENDFDDKHKAMHKVNTLQIVKRQRNFTDDEISLMDRMMEDTNIGDSLKVAISLLLEQLELFGKYYGLISDEDKEQLKSQPIWRFYSKMKTS